MIVLDERVGLGLGRTVTIGRRDPSLRELDAVFGRRSGGCSSAVAACIRRTAPSDTFAPMAEALTDADIKKIAKLSRLSLPDSQVGEVRTQLASILGHISKLQAVEVDGVEPMAHPLRIVNRLDADEPKATMPVDDLLRNAPAVEGRYLAVPKVLGDGGGA
jgi:aspartyl-tRNA(Asn)/glutamyl-tRNA(Gln) amidotransferase subunit C